MAYGIKRRNHDLWWRGATEGWTDEHATAQRFDHYTEAVLVGLSEGRLSPFRWEVTALPAKPGDDTPSPRIRF